MQENQPDFNSNSKILSFSKYSIFLSIIITISVIIRFYFLPTQIPLNSDALLYFWYSSDIYLLGELPKNWSPLNNGWSILVGIFFSIIDSRDIFTLMETQRLLSVIISVAIVIPTYFLCKKFVDRKFAIIGATLLAFEPRLMINSFLGIADPFYLLLITTSLTLFLYSNKKLVYLSFLLSSIAVLVRVEGIVFFLILSIMFFIRYRKENYKILLKYLFIIGIFSLIIMPMSIYKIEAIGEDGIFSRILNSGEQFRNNPADSNSITTNQQNKIIFGIENFFKYLGWVMIPNFLIFIPLGIFLILKNRRFPNYTIIFTFFAISIPALYAYTVPALDTRYLYPLFPIFAVISVISIERIIAKYQRRNLIIILIISAILISSVLFYDYKKIDYEYERESYEVMEKISKMIDGTNSLEPEASYLFSSKTITQWPTKYTEMKFIEIFNTNNFNSLNDYIENFKDRGLTHIIVDDKNDRPEFLKKVFHVENNVFLEKIYDSKENGFNYHVKVFKINYESYSKSLKN